MRIIFMGSPGFAVPSLKALAGAGHDIVAAYCQPPRPAGRGKAERKTAVHSAAEALGIPVRTPHSLRTPEAQGAFAALDADMAVVAAYGLILPKPILDAPKAGCINVHASLLPRWRGAAPIHRAILAGDAVTGVTIMRMDEGLDTGPMLLRRELRMDGKNTGQVMEELAELGAAALLEWIAHPAPPEPQPEADVTYAAKITKAETRIDWSKSAELIVRQVRAFAPAPGAWFEIDGERIKLLEAKAESTPRHPRESGNDGNVLDDNLLIGCGEGSLRPTLLQRAGRSLMNPKEFLRGFPIPAGTILK
ncbi:MAG: methionyl-tRNA formyltransferase [Sphingomicrobium sp.]